MGAGQFDHEPTTLESAIAVIEEYLLDEHNRNEALQEFAEEGCFTIPGDYRTIGRFGALSYVNPTAAVELLEAAKEALTILREIQYDLKDDKGEAHCIDCWRRQSSTPKPLALTTHGHRFAGEFLFFLVFIHYSAIACPRTT